MCSGHIKFVLFDAANTLIHKPLIWERMLDVLKRHHIHVDKAVLQRNHKMLSESIEFPDKTSSGFYHGFNSELLLSLGIIPSEELLVDIFSSCTYLPWEKFEDTLCLDALDLPIGVISNFNNQLNSVLNDLFGDVFSHVIVSEEKQLRKPDLSFYQLAQKAIGLLPDEILYVGDSLKLDIIPGIKMGWKVLLIDRLELFKASEHYIPDLRKIKHFL